MWKQLVNIWSQALEIYCEKVSIAKKTDNAVITTSPFLLPQYTLHFEKLLEAADNLMSKRVGIHCTLSVSAGL